MSSSQSFDNFLRSECVAIAAFVDEYEILVDEEEIINMKMMDHVSQYPELQRYFDAEDLEGHRRDEEDNTNIKLQLWTRSLRVVIIDHLIIMDINISLLIDIVTKYRYEAELEELIEIVRALDILGAEGMLSEYEALLYLKLKETGESKKEWERMCGERLPVSFFNNANKFPFVKEATLEVLGINGSRRLIGYFLEKYQDLNRNELFINLCSNGHLLVAQWLYDLGDVNISFNVDAAFRGACHNGHTPVVRWLYDHGGIDIHSGLFFSACMLDHLSMAQCLYEIGGINIRSNYDHVFRSTCNGGHLSVAQWLHEVEGVNGHASYDGAFRMACGNGHLSVAYWLYDLGEINIHVENDHPFRAACFNGHLLVAQWLYDLGEVNIHAEDNFAFKMSCCRGHLAVAQWIYNSGAISTDVVRECCLNSYNNDNQVQSWLHSILSV
jgi:hypothetical protein